MYSNDDLAYATFAILQSGFWPTSIQGWATLIVPTSIVFGFFGWLVKHFVIDPLRSDLMEFRKEFVQGKKDLTDEMVSEDARLNKSVRGLRRRVQTYLGKVEILDNNIRDCATTGQTNATKIAGLAERVTQTEKQYREIESELRDIKSLIEYKVLEKLEELSRNNPERGLQK